MGNILSFILNIPQSYKRMTFLDTDSYKISTMVYSGSNVLVIESKDIDGCRVLLNRKDLIRLQELEWCITENINEKELNIKPKIMRQMDEYCKYITEKCLRVDLQPKNLEEMENFIRNVEIRQSMATPSLSQIKMFATVQLAILCMDQWNAQNPKLYDKNFRRLSSLSPSYSLVNDEMSRLEEKINACDEINPLENDNNLDKYKYSSISPNYSSDNEISSIQKNDDISILAKPIVENNGFSNSLPSTSDGYDSDNCGQYPPWFITPRYIQPLPTSVAVDENDGPTVFVHSPPPSPSFFNKSAKKRSAQHPTPLRNVKRRLS